MSNDDLGAWRDRLEAARTRLVDRVAVIAETRSTQDAARAMAGGRPGLLVVAGRQTAGRGRLGRQWVQAGDGGLAATFVLPADRWPQGFVALAAGVATADAIDQALPAAGVGIRWPNDVVDRASARKIAGVLVERDGTLLLVGIGINVGQRDGDWPEALRSSATSIRQLGGSASRADVAERLLASLDRTLHAPPLDVLRGWTSRDVLLGRRAEFVRDGARRAGVVREINPACEIVLELDDGTTARLPAAGTSLVHIGAPIAPAIAPASRVPAPGSSDPGRQPSSSPMPGSVPEP